MKKYELNGMGKDWVFEASSEEEATLIYINECCNATTIKEYESYCEIVNVNPRITWKEFVEEEEDLTLEDLEDYIELNGLGE